MRRLDFSTSQKTLYRMGPTHPQLPGAMDLYLDLDGEVITSASVRVGYLHRGIEKVFRSRPWSSASVVASRLESQSPFFNDWVYCRAVEEILGIEVSERARVIRITLAELTRISSHLAFLRRVSEVLGVGSLYHYASRDRESVLDLLELISGSRWALQYCCVGGVRQDMTDGFQDRVLDVVSELRLRLKEYNDLFVFHRTAERRLQNIGVLRKEDVLRLGLTGPVARASGEAQDLRKCKQLDASYEFLDFEIPLGSGRLDGGGDVHDRVLVRMREVAVSLDILAQVCGSVPSGNYREPSLGAHTPPPGEAFSLIESPRGALACHVVSDGGKSPVSVRFVSPTRNLLSVVSLVLEGARLDDIGLILSSLDLSIAEADA